MEDSQIKKDVLFQTFSNVDEPFEKWRTFNDKINTSILFEKSAMVSKVDLEDDELPLLECILNNNFVLITTRRIISGTKDEWSQILLNEIDRFSNEYEKQNFQLIDGIPPKTNKIGLIDKNGNRFVFEIDSFHPAYFARILIFNLVKMGSAKNR